MPIFAYARAPAAADDEERRSPRAQASITPPPSVWGLALAAMLALAYLLISPPSGDLAAATYRSDLFARAGFTVWDDGWYAGHALPAYSLLAPSLGAWLGVRALLALSAIAAATLFGLLASRALPPRAARAATLTFAFGFCAELPSGRVPYDLGVAIGLAAMLPLTATPRSRAAAALAAAGAAAFAITTAAASPVAGAFLALVGLTLTLGARTTSPVQAVHGPSQPIRPSRLTPGLLAAGAALASILVLALAFPEDGYEPFAAGAFWPELAAASVVAALLPRGTLGARGRRTLRIGATLYALALTASFLLRTPMGGNAVRLGAMFGAPLIVGVLWQGGDIAIGRRRIDARIALLALAPLLLYWQLASAIDDQVALAGDRSVEPGFYAPLRAELLKLAGRASGHGAGGHGVGGHPIRIEVPLMGSHWEAAYLPGGPISLARGWERQLDTRYGALFYEPRLTSTSYLHWLQEYAIDYVALPKARLDSAGKAEARVIDARPSYLREVWHDADWQLFSMLGATPLVQPPARMLSVGVDSFSFFTPHAGSYEVRLHWTPYWSLRSGGGCVSRAADGFTDVDLALPGTVRVSIDPAPSRALSEGPRCER